MLEESGESESVAENEEVENKSNTNSVATQTASVISVTANNDHWTYLALVGVLLLGAFGVYLKPSGN